MILSIILSALLALICAFIAWRAKKFTDASISLLTTLIAALLALATYLYGLQSNDQDARLRLARLFRAELAETLKAVGGNAAHWKEVVSSGEPSTNVDYTFCPKIIAVEALKSGLFPNDEELIIDYLSAVDNYNQVIASSIGSFSIGKIPGNDSANFVGRLALSGAEAVNKVAIELMTEFKNDAQQN